MSAAMRIARILALVIAIGGIVDPAITSSRRIRPEVAVVSTTNSDSAALGRIEHALAKRFTIVRGDFGAAAATVLVGTSLPKEPDRLAGPVVAVFPATPRSGLSLTYVRAPTRASLDSKVSAEIGVRLSHPASQSVVVQMMAGGVVIDRSTQIVRNDSLVHALVSFVPTVTGVTPIRVVARVDGGRDSASADLVVDVVDRRFAVLFYAGRPSYQSTFARRVLERDPRFAVTSRVVTSRGVSTDAGRPPSAMDDPTIAELYDAIVVGAPEALTDRDVAGLERFLRSRGGSVVVMFDERPSGGAVARLTGATTWNGAIEGIARTIARTDGDSVRLRAAEIAWPTSLPSNATVVARTSDNRPIVWQSAVGAGRLTVSTALDAWRYRDPSTSDFDEFWRRTIADEAAAASEAVSVQLEHSVVAPNEMISVVATSREAALSEATTVRVSAIASIEGRPGNVDLWPANEVGQFRGTTRAPAEPGAYQLAVTMNGARATVPLVVSAAPVARVTPDDRALLAAFASASGGIAVDETDIARVIATLDAALRPGTSVETWYPMRSAWWIVPFAALLGIEWWWRRRRGLA